MDETETDIVRARFHSRISPSMMGRVENCTASYFLLPERPVRDATEYSTYGDVSHDVGEALINDPNILPFEIIGDVKESHGFQHEIDEEMLALVTPYVEECAQYQGEGWLWNTEQQFWLDERYRAGMDRVAGLIDFYGVPAPPVEPVVIVDFKSGRQFVAEDALQTAVYGLMVLDHFPGRAQTMTTVIVQPKADGPAVRRKTWTVEEVEELRKRITRFFKTLRAGKFFYMFGDHCTFCPVLTSCAKVRAIAKDAALAHVLASPEMLASGEFTTGDLEEALAFIPLLDKWSKAIVNTAEKYLEAGGALEGAKMVRKRTQRRWRKDADPVPLLEKHGIDPYTKKVLSPAQAEKAVPPAVRERLAGMIEKPVGGLTIAIGEDSRAAVSVRDSLRRAAENSKALSMLRNGEKRLQKSKAKE